MSIVVHINPVELNAYLSRLLLSVLFVGLLSISINMLMAFPSIAMPIISSGNTKKLEFKAHLITVDCALIRKPLSFWRSTQSSGQCIFNAYRQSISFSLTAPESKKHCAVF